MVLEGKAYLAELRLEHYRYMVKKITRYAVVK